MRARLRWRLAAIAAGATLALGCSNVVPQHEETRVPQVTWTGDISPMVQRDCISCHSGPVAAAAGNYSLDTYLGALGPGTDTTPNAIAGDLNSRILTALADPAHTGIPQSDVELLTRWVRDEQLAYTRSLVHTAGILNPAAPDFHGQLVADSGWDLRFCARCHGADYTGGAAGVACTSCHANGPTACDTCHGQPPNGTSYPNRAGSHQPHAEAPESMHPIDCDQCHLVPATWDAPGHVLNDSTPLQAEITFGPLARTTPFPARRAGPPAFDSNSKNCTNIYCHGGDFDDPKKGLAQPNWNTPQEADCSTCHGQPPADHGPQTLDCNYCHGMVVGPGAPEGVLVNPSLHLNGVIDVGTACNSCHGNAQNAAPPKDIAGDVLATAIGVGAHQSHVQGLHRLTAPIACTQCHIPVTQVTQPGHLDHPLPAYVFSAGGSYPLASADGVTPAWDHNSATCTVYCHGNGAKLAPDVTATLVRQPVWTSVSTGQAACGACHGIPPLDGTHDPALKLTDCVRCHANTVDAFGNILFTGAPGQQTSAHINGVPDVAP